MCLRHSGWAAAVSADRVAKNVVAPAHPSQCPRDVFELRDALDMTASSRYDVANIRLRSVATNGCSTDLMVPIAPDTYSASSSGSRSLAFRKAIVAPAQEALSTYVGKTGCSEQLAHSTIVEIVEQITLVCPSPPAAHHQEKGETDTSPPISRSTDNAAKPGSLWHVGALSSTSDRRGLDAARERRHVASPRRAPKPGELWTHLPEESTDAICWNQELRNAGDSRLQPLHLDALQPDLGRDQVRNRNPQARQRTSSSGSNPSRNRWRVRRRKSLDDIGRNEDENLVSKKPDVALPRQLHVDASDFAMFCHSLHSASRNQTGQTGKTFSRASSHRKAWRPSLQPAAFGVKPEFAEAALCRLPPQRNEVGMNTPHRESTRSSRMNPDMELAMKTPPRESSPSNCSDANSDESLPHPMDPDIGPAMDRRVLCGMKTPPRESSPSNCSDANSDDSLPHPMDSHIEPAMDRRIHCGMKAPPPESSPSNCSDANSDESLPGMFLPPGCHDTFLATMAASQSRQPTEADTDRMSLRRQAQIKLDSIAPEPDKLSGDLVHESNARPASLGTSCLDTRASTPAKETLSIWQDVAPRDILHDSNARPASLGTSCLDTRSSTPSKETLSTWQDVAPQLNISDDSFIFGNLRQTITRAQVELDSIARKHALAPDHGDIVHDSNARQASLGTSCLDTRASTPSKETISTWQDAAPRRSKKRSPELLRHIEFLEDTRLQRCSLSPLLSPVGFPSDMVHLQVPLDSPSYRQDPIQPHPQQWHFEKLKEENLLEELEAEFCETLAMNAKSLAMEKHLKYNREQQRREQQVLFEELAEQNLLFQRQEFVQETRSCRRRLLEELQLERDGMRSDQSRLLEELEQKAQAYAGKLTALSEEQREEVEASENMLSQERFLAEESKLRERILSEELEAARKSNDTETVWKTIAIDAKARAAEELSLYRQEQEQQEQRVLFEMLADQHLQQQGLLDEMRSHELLENEALLLKRVQENTLSQELSLAEESELRERSLLEELEAANSGQSLWKAKARAAEDLFLYRQEQQQREQRLLFEMLADQQLQQQSLVDEMRSGQSKTLEELELERAKTYVEEMTAQSEEQRLRQYELSHEKMCRQEKNQVEELHSKKRCSIEEFESTLAKTELRIESQQLHQQRLEFEEVKQGNALQQELKQMQEEMQKQKHMLEEVEAERSKSEREMLKATLLETRAEMNAANEARLYKEQQLLGEVLREEAAQQQVLAEERSNKVNQAIAALSVHVPTGKTKEEEEEEDKDVQENLASDPLNRFSPPSPLKSHNEKKHTSVKDDWRHRKEKNEKATDDQRFHRKDETVPSALAPEVDEYDHHFDTMDLAALGPSLGNDHDHDFDMHQEGHHQEHLGTRKCIESHTGRREETPSPRDDSMTNPSLKDSGDLDTSTVVGKNGQRNGSKKRTSTRRSVSREEDVKAGQSHSEDRTVERLSIPGMHEHTNDFGGSGESHGGGSGKQQKRRSRETLSHKDGNMMQRDDHEQTGHQKRRSSRQEKQEKERERGSILYDDVPGSQKHDDSRDSFIGNGQENSDMPISSHREKTTKHRHRSSHAEQEQDHDVLDEAGRRHPEDHIVERLTIPGMHEHADDFGSSGESHGGGSGKQQKRRSRETLSHKDDNTTQRDDLEQTGSQKRRSSRQEKQEKERERGSILHDDVAGTQKHDDSKDYTIGSGEENYHKALTSHREKTTKSRHRTSHAEQEQDHNILDDVEEKRRSARREKLDKEQRDKKTHPHLEDSLEGNPTILETDAQSHVKSSKGLSEGDDTQKRRSRRSASQNETGDSTSGIAAATESQEGGSGKPRPSRRSTNSESLNEEMPLHRDHEREANEAAVLTNRTSYSENAEIDDHKEKRRSMRREKLEKARQEVNLKKEADDSLSHRKDTTVPRLAIPGLHDYDHHFDNSDLNEKVESAKSGHEKAKAEHELNKQNDNMDMQSHAAGNGKRSSSHRAPHERRRSKETSHRDDGMPQEHDSVETKSVGNHSHRDNRNRPSQENAEKPRSSRREKTTSEGRKQLSSGQEKEREPNAYDDNADKRRSDRNEGRDKERRKESHSHRGNESLSSVRSDASTVGGPDHAPSRDKLASHRDKRDSERSTSARSGEARSHRESTSRTHDKGKSVGRNRKDEHVMAEDSSHKHSEVKRHSSRRDTSRKPSIHADRETVDL